MPEKPERCPICNGDAIRDQTLYVGKRKWFDEVWCLDCDWHISQERDEY